MIKAVVVEDEKLFRESLIRRLELTGTIQVVGAAENGIEGLLEIERLNPDVILSDIRMPGMDGLTFLEQIRKDHGETAVIFITGYMAFEYARKALQLGAFDYLLKPLDDRELARVIDRLKTHVSKLNELAFESEETGGAVLPQSLVTVAKQWVETHIGNATLQGAAEFVGMNPTAFSRKFHAEEGMKFIHYLTNIRMRKAAELLADPRVKVYEVSEKIGYLDKRHFTEVFKKYWGASPQEYRKSRMNDADSHGEQKKPRNMQSNPDSK